MVSMYPLLSLCLTLQRVEAAVPESLEEAHELREPLGARPVQAAGAAAALREEARLLQHVQVLGDRRPGHVEVGRDLARRELAVAHEGEDLAAAGGGDRAELGFHGKSVSSF